MYVKVEAELGEVETPPLLFRTVSMIVIARAPPKGTANDVMAITEVMWLGENLMPWRVLGMRRRPVPAPGHHTSDGGGVALVEGPG